jgi:hypothetical protein
VIGYRSGPSPKYGTDFADANPVKNHSRFDCLKLASAAVTARGDSYGTPEDNFRTTAAMWNAWLDQRVQNLNRTQSRLQFEPHDVAALLALLKLARLANDPKHTDSWVDLAGYAACGMETARIPVPAPAAATKPPMPAANTPKE